MLILLINHHKKVAFDNGINSAANSPAVNENTRKPDSNFTVEDGVLKKYNGTSSEVTIPNTVSSIDFFVFGGHTEITKVNIPSSVVSIGERAFYGCKNLIDISFPNSIKSIDSLAFDDTAWFANQQKKSQFVIANGIFIDGRMAKGDVIIPDIVTTINKYAFSANTSILTVVIPDSVISIGPCAFAMCYNLKQVTMTDFVTSIGGEAFYRCEALTDIKLSNSLPVISSSSFEGCRSLKSITLPSSTRTIGFTSFRYCTKLCYISVPDTLTDIWDFAFKSCGNNLTLYGNNNSFITTYAHNNYYKYKALKLEKTKATIFVGNKKQLNMNSLTKCKWISSNKNIATVNQSGKVTAKRKGIVTITASLYNRKYKCIVTVK